MSDFRPGLAAHLARVGGHLARHLGADPPEAAVPEGPDAVADVARLFALTPFEADLLVLAAAVELHPPTAALLQRANGGIHPYPTAALALAALPGAHWSALLPDRPLRRWGLLDVAPGGPLTIAPLRLDERVLHHLVGLRYLDERLRGLVEPLATLPGEVPEAALALASATRPYPVLAFPRRGDALAMATAAAEAIGLEACLLRARDLPVGAAELDGFVRAWEREAALGRRLLVVDELGPGGDAAATTALLDRVDAPVAILCDHPPSLRRRPVWLVAAPPSDRASRRRVWEAALGSRAAALGAAADQFRLPTHAVASIASTLTSDDPDALWDACRAWARPALDDLAGRAHAHARWDDLVLPEGTVRVLRQIPAQVRQRARVHEAWGWAARSGRGLGLCALFHGPPGGGKTMAAECIAAELRLDLYRVDLAGVVSKYIGETEKNLRRVFDAAESGGAVLLFDEADALFGARGEVHDSHDRYANLEVSYLLQRVEEFDGLAILTTNFLKAVDRAFLRRVRFLVEFPLPDAELRERIWGRVFPPDTPRDKLDLAELARLPLSGGHIRNVALNATFLAADCGRPVAMSHLTDAARAEVVRLGRALPRGWGEG